MTDAQTVETAHEPIRVAAVDVGTNSIRLIVAESRLQGGYRVIDDEKIVSRLGLGLAESGRIQDDIMERAVDAIGTLKAIADGYNVLQLRVIATCAVREAENGQTMLDMVQERTGLDMEIISAEEEARLAYQSVSSAFELSQMNAAIVDVGGGSTEIVLCHDGVIEHVCSLPLGAVRLTDMFGSSEAGDDERHHAMRKHIKKVLRTDTPKPTAPPQLIFGTGGTFTNMASMSMHRGSTPANSDVLPFAVRGYELQRDEIKHMVHHLRLVPVAERGAVPGLNPDRADIIVAGMSIIDLVMKRLGANRVRVHDRGIRDGLISTMIDDLTVERRERQPTIERVRSARSFAQACRYEQDHSEHVAKLALSLFDGLAELDRPSSLFDFSPLNRELLESAALLHDTGYLINYAKHHKHSYHLIVHSDMAGFTNRELEIVANVARYHRRSAPKSKHPNFMKLAVEDQWVVRCLSAILRIADGLDRSHTQSVTLLGMSSDAATLFLNLGSRAEAKVNVWGAERKAELFVEVFGLRPRFNVVSHFEDASLLNGRTDDAG